MTMRSLAALAAASGLAVAPALGWENRFDFVVSNVISPEQPSATVDVWAVFDANYYALEAVAFDVLAEADPGGFSGPERMLKGPGSRDGDVAPDGDSVLGITVSQLFFPICGCFPDTANPILVWRVMWSTEDFAPRMVGLGTQTSNFDVFIDEDLDGDGFPDGNFESVLNSLIEGSGAIQVVPAPGGLAVLAAGGLAAMRCRRTRTGVSQ